MRFKNNQPPTAYILCYKRHEIDRLSSLSDGGIRWMKIGKMQYARHW